MEEESGQVRGMQVCVPEHPWSQSGPVDHQVPQLQSVKGSPDACGDDPLPMFLLAGLSVSEALELMNPRWRQAQDNA